MEILVDTHALIWGLTDESRLGPAAGEVLADSDTIVWVSAASAWEIATKVRIGKMPGAAHLVVDFGEHLRRWYASALGIEPADALHAGVMDWPHRDPFDRMLAAQALRRGIPLISRDEVFDDLPGLRRLW